MLKAGCTKTSGWKMSDLSEAGKWFVKMMQSSLATVGGTSAGDDSGSGGAGGDSGGNDNSGQSTEREASFGGVKISAGITNGWGDSPFYKQYALRIENTGTKELSGWKLVLTFSDRIELESGWCGHFSVSGRKLIITPESYNSHITAGGCVENVGFIVKGSKAPEMVEIAWR